jgi:SAM-dependent methyltransferase
VPSPNIWQHPATYELENHAVDPAGLLDAAIRDHADWAGRTVLDIGCGTGFHLPRFADAAREVVGVEPHPDLLAIARRRTRRLTQVRVLQGTAQALPLPNASVDVAHARWAYFFGPGCEPGLAELARVVRRGGSAFVIDHDASRSTYGGWFGRGFPRHHAPAAVERFWSSHGWTRHPVNLTWSFADRAGFESVIRIEFPPELAEEIVREHAGLEVDYAVNVWWRDF